MNLKQLSAFREVMLTGSVSEAARNLYRSQPAISSLIAGLEDDIGFKLFARRGGRRRQGGRKRRSHPPAQRGPARHHRRPRSRR